VGQKPPAQPHQLKSGSTQKDTTMSRGVYSESSLRGEIEYALQYVDAPDGDEWTLSDLAAETAADYNEVVTEVADLDEEGFVTRRGEIVTWN
jgi:hypothetical protein